jgi:ABC-type sugar transport system ATPase subunit
MKLSLIALAIVASTAVQARETIPITKQACWALEDQLRTETRPKRYADTNIFTTHDQVLAITCSRGLVHRYTPAEYQQLTEQQTLAAEQQRQKNEAEFQKVIDRIMAQ